MRVIRSSASRRISSSDCRVFLFREAGLGQGLIAKESEEGDDGGDDVKSRRRTAMKRSAITMWMLRPSKKKTVTTSEDDLHPPGIRTDGNKETDDRRRLNTQEDGGMKAREGTKQKKSNVAVT